MTRTADHEARREQLARAVRRLTRREGLDQVTVAKVAAESGVSVGLVQHYFPSKRALLVHAYASDLAATWERVAAVRARGTADRERIEDSLLAALSELLPLDERRSAELVVRQSFAALGSHDEEVRTMHAAAQRAMREAVAAAVGNGRECGEVVDPDLDAGRVAVELLALVDGLAGQLATGGVSQEAAEEVLAARLAAVFPGPCRHWQDA